MWLQDSMTDAAVMDALRKRILKSKDPTMAAFATQQALLKDLEEAALAWTDNAKPDIRTVIAVLYRLRDFRWMLRLLGDAQKRKKKTNAARNLARRRARDRRRRSQGRPVVARRTR